MPLQRLKAGFGVFFLLCGLFGVNLFVFQGSVVAAAAKRIVFPSSAAKEGAQPISYGADERAPPSVALSAPETTTPATAAFGAQADVTTGSVSEPDLTRAVQRELQVLGYDSGSIDGVAGLTTRAAIMAFEWDQGSPLTGEPSQHTLQALLMGNGRGGQAGASSGVAPSLQASQVIRSVQEGLKTLGYAEVKSTGLLTSETQRAIRLFEVREGLTETGRISGGLASRLVRLTSEKRLAERK